MVELQSCSTLVSASALCTIEQEVKGDSVSVAEISAELERERKKNAELMERISMLEAQIRERNTETQESHQHAAARSLNNFKRQKIEMVDGEIENMNIVKSEMASEYKPDTEGIVPKEINPGKLSISWMSLDDNQLLDHEKIKDREAVAHFNQIDSEDACNDNCDDDMNNRDNSQIYEEMDDIIETVRVQGGYFADYIDEESNITSSGCQRSDPTGNVKQEDHEQKTICLSVAPLSEKNEAKSDQGKEMKETAAYTAELEAPSSKCVHISQNRKPPKVAFCPKEVKRIIESEALEQKNGQIHTMRKILVFATLGTRHGCEDMYELDFNHFSILNKGEPYVSPRNPGEHILYENPGVRRKIFYPNRQNPVLCPVQVLEEERAMRPSDPSCPSCLFLCIKYGGSTRNFPQNEYVRQRMGRNKLKSFGPLMSRMAMLVHIRSGSFFFKALGITLLFMAGFPDDLVQRETKYQNLDLLQKYYRTDEDAEGEELFLPYPIACNNGTHEPQSLTKKTLPAKSKGRKHDNAIIKSHNSQNTPSKHSTPTTSAPAQFGLTGYSSSHTYVMAPFHSVPSQSSQDIHSSYSMMPPQSSSAFVPVMYWPPPNAFLHGPYHSTYAYQSFPSTANYASIQTGPYYNNHTSSFSSPKLLEGSGKNDSASEETENDESNSSSSATEHKLNPEFHK